MVDLRATAAHLVFLKRGVPFSTLLLPSRPKKPEGKALPLLPVDKLMGETSNYVLGIKMPGILIAIGSESAKGLHSYF